MQAEEKMKLKEKEKIKEKKEVGREEMENEKMEHNIHIEPITGQFRYNSNIFIEGGNEHHVQNSIHVPAERASIAEMSLRVKIRCCWCFCYPGPTQLRRAVRVKRIVGVQHILKLVISAVCC